MGYVYYNPNPERKLVGDCVVRAISKATGKDWESIFVAICVQGMMMHDMPSSNAVWGRYLQENGYQLHSVRDVCPPCDTVQDFVSMNPGLSGILGTGSHVIAIDSGSYFDTWDSGNESPLSLWIKEE